MRIHNLAGGINKTKFGKARTIYSVIVNIITSQKYFNIVLNYTWNLCIFYFF